MPGNTQKTVCFLCGTGEHQQDNSPRELLNRHLLAQDSVWILQFLEVEKIDTSYLDRLDFIAALLYYMSESVYILPSPAVAPG